MSRKDYNRMVNLLTKEKRQDLSRSEAKELWQLKQANMKDNRDYLEG